MADDTPPASPTSVPLELTLGGTTYPLSHDTPAPIRAEAFTGRTLIQLVEAGSDGSLSIVELAKLTAALAVSSDNDPLLGGTTARMITQGYCPAVLILEAIGAAIVEAGVMYVMPRLIIPLALALRPAEG